MEGQALFLIVLGLMFLILLFLGVPLVFAIGALAIVMAVFLLGVSGFPLLIYRTLSVLYEFVLLAAPLFIFMGAMLAKSGAADDMYEGLHRLFGPLRGSLAVGTIVTCTIMAAMTGITGAATVAMGLIALPAMFKRGYNKALALGSVAGGGTLGVLIPPSLPMIFIGASCRISIGKLFAGGIIPGLIMSSLFILYIIIRSAVQPNVAPALAKEERQIPLKRKLGYLARLIPPALLILAVLGSIFAGIATPTEAAAIGAFGAIVYAVARKSLTCSLLQETLKETLRITCMILWILIASQVFSVVFNVAGGPRMLMDALLGLEVGRWGVVIAIQLFLFVLGMFMDQVAIIWMFAPIFMSIIKTLGFDPIWFGVLLTVNIEIAYLTPPFGYNLFYLKGVAPPDVTMGDIYRSIVPFVLLQILTIAILMVWPNLILWLPNLIR